MHPKKPFLYVWRFCLGLLVGVWAACTPLDPEELTPDALRSELTAPTGSMSKGRYGFTTTELPDGRVLIVGGVRYGDATGPSEVELYLPARGLFVPTGRLAQGRNYHTATLLQDGRVLVTGGYNASNSGAPIALSEVYEPVSGRWSPAGTMVTPRQQHTATLLADGRVLVIGGYDVNGNYLKSTELYDPATQTWTAAAPTAIARSRHTATRLSGGKVLVVGGSNFYSTDELYDPATNTWALAGSTLLPRREHHSAFALPGDRVLVFGGKLHSSTTPLTETFIFDLATGAWTATGSMPVGTSGSRAVGLPDGRVFVAGGYRTDSSYATEVMAYDPGSGTWSTLGGMSIGRIEFGLALLPTRRLVVVGGWTPGAPRATETAELLDTNMTCVPLTCASSARVCGSTSDGCGGTLSCGTCATGLTCTSGGSCVVSVTASHDVNLKAPACRGLGPSCSSGSLIRGRGTNLFEPRAPNTLQDSCADGNSGTFHTDESLDALQVSTYDTGDFAPGKAVRIDATVWAAFRHPGVDRLDLYHAADATQPVWTHITTLTPDLAQANTLTTTFVLPTGSLQAIRGVFRYEGSAAPCVPGLYNDHDDIVFAVSVPDDRAPPTVALTNPTAGATLRDYSTVTATASDDVGVVKVEFYAGQTLIATTTGAPFTFQWYTPDMPNGTHMLVARAYDPVGNITTSAPVMVTLSNDKTPPTTSILSPAAGATVRGLVQVEADARDNVGVRRVELLVNGSVYMSDNTALYTFSWDTSYMPNGTHRLETRAYDDTNNVGTSAPILVTVDNDRTAPTVSITSPQSGSTVNGTVTLTATASDNVGVTKVEYYNGSVLLGSATVAPYSKSWDTSSLGGSYSLTAKAYDAAGNVATSAPVSVFVPDTLAPSVSIIAPAAGAVVSGTTTLSVSTSDNSGTVSRVEYYVNGALHGTVTTAPYSLAWNTTGLATGSYRLLAKAYDAAGNEGQSLPVDVTVSLAPPSPSTRTYSASNTSSATVNTVNQTIILSAGQTLTLGTCGVTGASFTGDTYLRLYNPGGTQVTSNDDACGGVGSKFTYTVPAGAGGSYQLRAGCYSSGSCGGTVAWTIQ